MAEEKEDTDRAVSNMPLEFLEEEKQKKLEERDKLVERAQAGLRHSEDAVIDEENVDEISRREHKKEEDERRYAKEDLKAKDYFDDQLREKKGVRITKTERGRTKTAQRCGDGSCSRFRTF